MKRGGPILKSSKSPFYYVAEMQGLQRIAGGFLIFESLRDALTASRFWNQSIQHANLYICAVQTAEIAALNSLRKEGFYTQKTLEENLAQIRQFNLLPPLLGQDGRSVQMPPSILQTEVKLRRIMLQLEPILDPHYYGEFALGMGQRDKEGTP